jgi:hypothetical protein
MTYKRASIPMERNESRIFFIRGQKLRSQSVISNSEGCFGRLGLHVYAEGGFSESIAVQNGIKELGHRD